MLKSYVSRFALVGVFLFASGPVFAGATGLSSPNVYKGAFELETKGYSSLEDDDSKLKTEVEGSYGITDRLAVEVEGEWEKEPSDQTRYEATVINGKYELFKPNEAWLQTAVKFGYAFGVGPTAADALESELILRKAYGPWQHTANIGFDYAVGENREGGLGTELAFQTLYTLPYDLKAGFEYYAELGELDDMPDFDDQSHYIGPVVDYHIHGLPVHFQLGYLWGITDASEDSVIRWKAGIEF